MKDDEGAIRELIHTWMAATQSGSTDKVMSLMADDVIFLVPGREPFGKAAFEATSKEQKNLRIEGTAAIREMNVLGDWAYVRCFLKIKVTPPDGSKPARRSGYTLTILRKQPDGRWLLSRDANLLTPED